MTMLIHFHQSRYRAFKDCYTGSVLPGLRREFPGLVSGNRFVELTPAAPVPRAVYWQPVQGRCNGIAGVDATVSSGRHNQRIPRHRACAGGAQRGQTSQGWRYGFQLHRNVNDHGEIPACRRPPGNGADRKQAPAGLG